MTQELGRIERPSSEDFRGKRKLLLVPQIYHPPTLEEEGAALLSVLWEQVQTQVSSLQAGLGPVKHIYHESVVEGGEDGVRSLEAAETPSLALVRELHQAGATLEATEDAEGLWETIDLQRCLMLPLSSEKVATQLREWFNDSARKRYEHIAGRIDETLGQDEVGLLVINERHQAQFPTDIDVFYVAPPALDLFRRWLDGWVIRQRAEMEAQAQAQGE